MEGDESHSDVREFAKITSCTQDQAKFYLEASGGDLDNAVMMYMGDLGYCLITGEVFGFAVGPLAPGPTMVLKF